MTVLLASTAAQADQAPSELGLWERFCINNKIADACDRAVKSLDRKINQANNDQAAMLEQRLLKVSELGCSLKNKYCCEQLVGSALETTEGPTISQNESEESSLADPE